MPVRGVRGATVVLSDSPEAILEGTSELLAALLAANHGMEPTDIASVLFTMSEDLASTYPAQAARKMGWSEVPLLCAREIPVPTGLSHCIRILIHWNTSKPQSEIIHVYLHDAVRLRPDLSTI